MTTPITLIQITDLHLVQDPAGRLRNVPTWETLTSVLEHVSALDRKVDMLVLTGDIAHDEIAPTYAALARKLENWPWRCRLVPGNHDRPSALSTQFGGNDLSLPGRHGFSMRLGEWQVIGLDSHVPGEVWGELGSEQLDWLAAGLAACADAPTVLFVHHPPMPVGKAWIDEIGLRDAQALRSLVAAHPSVRLVACGHVHGEFEVQLEQALFCTTPSTAFQFADSNRPGVSPTVPPGYRWIELWPDQVKTGINYLTHITHVPDNAAI